MYGATTVNTTRQNNYLNEVHDDIHPESSFQIAQIKNSDISTQGSNVYPSSIHTTNNSVEGNPKIYDAPVNQPKMTRIKATEQPKPTSKWKKLCDGFKRYRVKIGATIAASAFATMGIISVIMGPVSLATPALCLTLFVVFAYHTYESGLYTNGFWGRK